jgi:2-polyprenyl-3-methyl-5-hydroxy-6-metoxy-1,4-benzoquinol methylase
MYPVEYQGAIETDGSSNEILDILGSFGNFTSLLDYGCGNGRFISKALEKGYKVTGTEFNAELVESLQHAFPAASFMTIEQFFKTGEKYDVILLSNVLEHLVNPKEIMLKLKTHLNPGGIFVLEGPVENNFTLTKYALHSIFLLRKKLTHHKASHAPLHVFYSDRQNQENFFKSIGLQTLHYRLEESHWPFPSSLKASDTMLKKMMFLIADASVRLGSRFPFWGNNFKYIGRPA